MYRSYLEVLFFFSSRRRHTRLQGDWSSDVCSSDLPPEHRGNRHGGRQGLQRPAGRADPAHRRRHHLQQRRQAGRSEEHTSELQSPCNLVCRLLLEKKKKIKNRHKLITTYKRTTIS